ncbi:MAG: 3-coathanger stack domain-containing protein, partial [Bacteroidota bacterium]
IIFFLFLFQITANAQTVGTQGEVRWRIWNNTPYVTETIEDFTSIERYPNGPDYVRTLNSLSTPYNYRDFYGSHIRGFLQSTTGGRVVFNVNAADRYQLRISTDATAANLVDINADTSEVASLDTLVMVPNQHYYFEINHVEFWWEDYLTVEWKGDFLFGGIGATDWITVGGDYIFDTNDTPCPVSGTACDDGNPNTQNDRTDGNCHCVGTPTTTNTCIGEKGAMRGYVYNNLSGNALTPLDNAISNGTNPDSIYEFEDDHFWRFNRADQGDWNSYGVYYRGYLQVPVSGYYDFNITGTRANVFYLSSDENPANKAAYEMRTLWWTPVYGHDTFDDRTPSQTVTQIYLDSTRYYYVEVRHKGDGGWERFNLFWKTPYQSRDEWVFIPNQHFYEYTCDAVCVASGVGCDDGDPYTTNDVWDGNCSCAGTPCVAPNCDDPTTSYVPADECETTNEIDNRADDAWLSCAPLSDAPNSIRNGQHWIQYDFGKAYDLGTTQVWNYNAQGATNMGFQQVTVDYSTDGINWQELGTYNWALATGAADYAGFVGPDFSNVTARYVLISSQDDPNSCRGFSKIAFNAVECPDIQFITPTIDESILSTTSISNVSVAATGGEATVNSVALYLNDMWIADDNAAPFTWSDLPALQNLANGDYQLAAVALDANGTECELATVIHALALEDFPCQSDSIYLDTTEAMAYRTERAITSTGLVDNSTTTNYVAEQSITLMPGFHAMAGSSFTARIAACTTPSASIAAVTRENNSSNNLLSGHEVKLFPNPVVDNFTVEIDAFESNVASIQIYDVLGKVLRQPTTNQTIRKGTQQISVSASGLAAGLYYCQIRIGAATFTRSFVVGE